MKSISLLALVLFTLVSVGRAQELNAKLLDNKFNKQALPVGDFGQVDQLIESMKKDDRNHLLKLLNNKGVTLYEASFGMYFLAITYLHEGDIEKGISLLHVAAEDYLNPIALSEMARIYYHGADEMHHIFPKEHLEGTELNYEKDLEKSFVTLNLAFEIAHYVTKTHHNPHIMKMVSSDGVELLERFTFKNEADELKEGEEKRALLQEDLKKDLELLAKYKEMYAS